MPAERLPSYHPNLRVERDGHVTTVTIDNPETKNACSGDMFVALGRLFAELGYSGTRAILLTGANEHFCSGADLSGTKNGAAPSGSTNILDGLRVLADVVISIHDCPVPVVAKVDGLCVGGGLGLALAADLTWCSDRARFSAIFAKRGLSLDTGTSWLLRERVGVHKAKELAFTAKVMSGAEAYQLGLVNGVVPAAELDAVVEDVVATIAAGPPMALSMMKRQLDNAVRSSLPQALEAESLAQRVNTQTDDMREALTAYIERRPPMFTGR